MLTSYEAGNANQGLADSFVLNYASQQGRAVLTYDRRDFFRLHRETDRNHGGIIACTVDPDVEALASRIDGAIGEAGDVAGKLLKVYRN